MDKENSEFPVGYRKPPHHTRYKPGESGNPSGRPKKKFSTFADSIARELNTMITVTEGGKRRWIKKLDAIAKQQTNKALKGDHKATALLMKTMEPREFDSMDNLSPVLSEMRAIHAKHELANHNAIRTAEAADVARHVENKVDNDEN